MFNASLNNGGGDSVGTVKAWGGLTPPAGWLFCDGSKISRTLYGALFAVIGTTYGAGDGTTTFNLPNLSGITGNVNVKYYNSSSVNAANLQQPIFYDSTGNRVVGGSTTNLGLSSLGGITTKSGGNSANTNIYTYPYADLSNAGQKAKAIIKY